MYFSNFTRTLIFNLLNYTIIVGGTYLVVCVIFRSWARKHRIQDKPFLSSDIRREIYWSLFDCLIMAAATALLMPSGKQTYLKFYADPARYGWAWFFLSFPVLVIVSDAHFYFFHRILHHPFLFKHVHYVHHRSTNPSAFGGYNWHPIEALITAGYTMFLPLIVPVPVQTFTLFLFFSVMLAALGHLGTEMYPLSWRQKSILKYTHTATSHNYHHEHINQNYGLFLLYLDRLFGTFGERIEARSVVSEKNS
jgi:lathosterol oxidase